MCVKLAQRICISEEYNFVVAVFTSFGGFFSSNLKTLLDG